MPTLRQVNIHPQTREKLSSGLKRKSSTLSSSSSTSNCIELPTDNDKNPAAASLGVSSFVPIRTPSALLSRDPTKLSTDLNTSLHDIHTLRVSVAREIISNSYSGHARNAADVAAEVTEFCCINNDAATNEQQETKEHVFTRSKPFISGAITALDMCAHARYIKTVSSRCNNKRDSVSNQQHSNYLTCIRTGSDAIDTLLAPDHSYSSFDGGWSMPHPFEGEYLMSSYSSASQSGCERGVPFGMVTEFSGPPSSGKTQLVLSIVTNAVMMNGLKVHYISGGNSRRAVARRLFAMFNEFARSQNSTKHGQMMTEDQLKSIALKKLNCVQISSVPDAYSLLAVLVQINAEEVSCQTDNEISKKCNLINGTLLIVDSVASCLGHHLASDTGAALASQVASTLRDMVRTHDGRLRMSSSIHIPKHEQNSQLRRFAVVVTNGSVARRSSDQDPRGNHTQHQPAMGQYWHVSDVGIWLEEDKSSDNDDSSSHQPICFYDYTPPVALSLAEKKIIRATLLNHYGKSCRSETFGHSKSFAKFSIRSIGITDVE